MEALAKSSGQTHRTSVSSRQSWRRISRCGARTYTGRRPAPCARRHVGGLPRAPGHAGPAAVGEGVPGYLLRMMECRSDLDFRAAWRRRARPAPVRSLDLFFPRALALSAGCAVRSRVGWCFPSRCVLCAVLSRIFCGGGPDNLGGVSRSAPAAETVTGAEDRAPGERGQQLVCQAEVQLVRSTICFLKVSSSLPAHYSALRRAMPVVQFRL